MTRVLVVEDNPDLAFGLQAMLEFEGFRVDVAGSGEDALELVERESVELVVLDVMLPGIDGFEVLAQLRRRGHGIPVLMLTARTEERDVLHGFSSGADDYLTKPFSSPELLARVRALLRRTKTPQASAVRFGEIELDAESRVVTRGGREVSLTPKEFDLLLALAARSGGVASRDELLKEVWGYASVDVQTRTVDIHVAELRRKLESDPGNPRHILTVRKVGYRLQG